MIGPSWMLALRRASRVMIQRVSEIGGPTLIRWPRGFGLFEIVLYLRVGSLEWLRRHRLIIGELEERTGFACWTLVV